MIHNSAMSLALSDADSPRTAKREEADSGESIDGTLFPRLRRTRKKAGRQRSGHTLAIYCFQTLTRQCRTLNTGPREDILRALPELNREIGLAHQQLGSLGILTQGHRAELNRVHGALDRLAKRITRGQASQMRVFMEAIVELGKADKTRRANRLSARASKCPRDERRTSPRPESRPERWRWSRDGGPTNDPSQTVFRVSHM